MISAGIADAPQQPKQNLPTAKIDPLAPMAAPVNPFTGKPSNVISQDQRSQLATSMLQRPSAQPQRWSPY